MNNKVYIGQTTRPLSHRWTQHIRDSRTMEYKLYRAMRKYGVESFKIEEIDGANSKSELNYREWLWIMKYESHTSKKGYNIQLGGNGVGKHSKETKQKIREASIRNGFGKWERTEKHNENNRISTLAQHADPDKRLKFLIANGSKEFNVYKAIIIKHWKRGPKGGKGEEAIIEKGELVGTWLDSGTCSRDLDLKAGNIGQCLRKEKKTHKNYIFEYK